MKEIFTPIGLILLGLLLVASEAFVPSAGILGILAGLSLLSGVVMAFYYLGSVVGTIFLVITGTLATLLIMKMVQWWPKSAIGKRILVEPPQKEDLLVDRSETDSMVGRYGKTLGLMMPGGMIEIEGKRYDALAETAIEAGMWVQVTRISSGRILNVLPVDAETVLRSEHAAERQSGDPLESADDVFSDPFADA